MATTMAYGGEGIRGTTGHGLGEPTILADEQFIERQRLFEDFLSSDVLLIL